MVKLLIIGQMPPPYVGQMLSIQSLVLAHYPDISIYHTRMNYSKRTSQIGKVSLRKIFHLLRVIAESGYKILRHRIDVIYYPPGADTIPLLRDIVTLIVLRRFRRKLILVFHASGMSETIRSWKGIRFWLARKAFFFPDAAIQKSSLNPPDGAFVKAGSVYTVPNGWPDHFEKVRRHKVQNLSPVILFVGLIREDKGVGILLEAAQLLKERGHKFQIRFVGEFSSADYARSIARELRVKGLERRVEFCGRLVDDEKWAQYQRADIFCFPTFYPAESFGNVIVEAMMFELPVVATRWRGIPDIVEDRVTGFLTEIKDATGVAERLEQLIQDKRLRTRMGRRGRERYLRRFTVEEYLGKTRAVILDVAKKESNGHRTEKHQTPRRIAAQAG